MTSFPESLVIVGFAEALSAPEVVWSLVDAGYKVMAFARRGRHGTLRHSRHVKVHEITSPEDCCSSSLAELKALLESFDQGVLLPIDDASVWLCARVSLSSGWILAGPRDKSSELALNKEQQIQAATAAGFNVPSTSIVPTVEGLASGRSHFPLILRPANAVVLHQDRLRRGRNWICSDEKELDVARAAWDGTDRLLLQPFLEGTGEGVFGLATENGVVAWSAHRRLRMMNPHGSGSSACVSQPVANDVRSAVAKFVNDTGWLGMFMIELLRTGDGKLWFVEFNGRAWGSMALARRQSFEYPAWAVQLAKGSLAVADFDLMVKDGVVCRNLGRELMHVLFVLRGSQSRAIKKWPSFYETLKKLFTSHRSSSFYNWRRDDWRVFVSDCWYTIRDQVFKTH